MDPPWTAFLIACNEGFESSPVKGRYWCVGSTKVLRLDIKLNANDPEGTECVYVTLFQYSPDLHIKKNAI